MRRIRHRHRLLHAALVAGLALLMAGIVAPAAQAAPVELNLRPWTRWLVSSGEGLTLAYVQDRYGLPLPTGSVYIRNDTQRGYTRVPLTRVSEDAGYGAPALVARVPRTLVRGHKLLYYAALRDPVSGRAATIPAGGASKPQRVWVLTRPLTVALGSHSFGHLTRSEAIVAKAGPDEVGWFKPGEGASFGPWSFDIGRDGSVWLLDEVNDRLLVWSPGRPERRARLVPLPFQGAIDLALGRDGTVYVTGEGAVHALTPSGKELWTSPFASESLNEVLRVGPDGAVYSVDPGGDAWMAVTTPAGRPLPTTGQRRTSPLQPVSAGLRLVSSSISDHEQRFALIDKSDNLVRAWRVTSTGATELGRPPGATVALVGGEVVLPLSVSQETTSRYLWEHLVVRLTTAGEVRQRVTLDARAVWGDDLTSLRIGYDGGLYQLRTSPTFGVRIARYSLGATRPAPPTTHAGAGGTPTPSTVAPPGPTGITVPTIAPTAPAQPVAARPAGRPLLPWLAALGIILVTAAAGTWAVYRHRHARGPIPPIQPHPAQ